MQKLNAYTARVMVVLFSLLCFAVGCATIHPAKAATDFMKDGELWGEKHRANGLKPGDIDNAFVKVLASKTGLDFFGVNADMREAFVKGYRSGYQDKTADLVLEPNFNAAKAMTGN